MLTKLIVTGCVVVFGILIWALCAMAKNEGEYYDE